MTRELADAAARERIRCDLASTLIVEAAAGTGKTTALVGRILAVIREGRATLERIVAVTFTEKAAGEMKLRLRGDIETFRNDPTIPQNERLRLDQALAHLEAARIGTIHALCADLLRERPLEARVDPLFTVLDEEQARRLFDEAFDRWFERVLASPGEGVRRMLRRRPRGRDAWGPRRALAQAAWNLVEHRDFAGAWRRDPFDRDREIERLVTRLAELPPLAARADWADDPLAKLCRKMDGFLAELARVEAIRGRDHDGLEAELVEVTRWWDWKRDGRKKQYGEGLLRAEVIALREEVKEDLDAFLERAAADLAARLHEELAPIAGEYTSLKARTGALDFLDLLVQTRDLVKHDRGVREELQRRFSHVFVDEFQDTDPLQAEILLLLAADDPAERAFSRAHVAPGKLFVVGDPKQSIYRFRRADVLLYEATKRRLVGAGASVVYLTTSFRSAPSIQGLVNAAFSQAMQGGAQAEYVPLSAFREDPAGQPTVVALPAPKPYGGWGDLTKKAIDESLPDAVGAFIDWLVHQSGWRVTQREGPPIPVEPRHVCLLFKRFQSFSEDVTRPYVRALEARRIPHVLLGGRSFHAREEVLALRTALAAIEWPEDDLSVFATLRGPFFALQDDALLAFRDAVAPFHPLAALAREREGKGPVSPALADVEVALRILGRLHLGRNRRPVADTIARLLDATRAHAGIAIWPTGEQALANVLRVMDLARKVEGAGLTSFRAFVLRLDDEAESGQAAEAPIVEEGTEGVRMMTVHRAKGLEFPVVVLVDPTAPLRHERPSRHVDVERNLWLETLAGLAPVELIEHAPEALARDEEESVRVAYVAATRARDLLVVPVCGDGRVDGWVQNLFPALYPPPVNRRLARAAAGCPPFGDDSVVDWPSRVQRVAEISVAPGAHTPEVGDHTVVWWDPGVLDLDRDAAVGLRQQQILIADERPGGADGGTAAHEAWVLRRAGLLTKGGVPSARVETITALAVAAAEADPAARVPIERTAAVRHARPHGKRFGTLVHGVLAEVDLAADAAAIDAAAALVGRLVDATPDEIAAAVVAVREALAHPLFDRARAASAVRREAPVVLHLDDGTVADGVVDLAFREDGPRWTIVDYKTDVELAGGEAKYAAQLALYCRAIEAATGEPASAVLLAV